MVLANGSFVDNTTAWLEAGNLLTFNSSTGWYVDVAAILSPDPPRRSGTDQNKSLDNDIVARIGPNRRNKVVRCADSFGARFLPHDRGC